MKNILSITIALFLLISGCGKDDEIAPIIVDFSASSVSITAGESVMFTDLSSGNPTSWEWTFEGKSTQNSIEQNPTITFNDAGEYTVILFAFNESTSGEKENVKYISVNVKSSFSANTQMIYTGESVTFSDESNGSPDIWEWTFEGVASKKSSDQNPLILYTEAGEFDVSLQAFSEDFSDTKIEENFIIVNTKPIAHFPFDGDAKDIIEGIIIGEVYGATLTTDRNDLTNGAYGLDGTNDYINFGDVYDFGTSDFAISLWANITEFKGEVAGTGSSGAWILNKGITIYGTPSRSGYGIKIQKIDGENHIRFFVGGTTNQTFYAGGMNDFKTDQWYHIIGKREGNQISLYVDGNLISEKNIENNLDTNTNIPFSIGKQDKLGNDPSGTTYFEGTVDEIKLFDKAISTNEIIRLSKDKASNF